MATKSSLHSGPTRLIAVGAVRIAAAALLSACLMACDGGGTSLPEVPTRGAAPPAAGATDSIARQAESLIAGGEVDEAIRVLEKALGASPDSPDLAVVLARAYRRDERYAAARKILDRLLARTDLAAEDRAAAREALVASLLDEGKLEEAREAIRPLLAAKEISAAAHRLAGIIAYRGGENDRALSELKEAVRIAPSDADSLIALGVAHLQAGNLTQAAAALEEAVRQDPGSQFGFSNLAKVYQRQGRAEEAEKARARYTEILDRKAVGRKTAPLRTQGVEAYNAGRFPEALEKFLAVLEISPRDHQALAQAGSSLLAMQRLDEAEGYLRRALEVRPQDDFAWTELGRSRAMRNDIPGAIEMFQRAAAANPQAAEPHYFLAGIYYSQRRKEDFLREREAFQRLRGPEVGSLIPLPDPPP